MKVVITGAKGLLGQEVSLYLQENTPWKILPFSHTDLDILDRERLYKVLKEERPDVVINCAGYTDVDKAEEEREKAFLINAIGVQNLALASYDLNIPLFHISTDYVFAGEKNTPYNIWDNVNPINFYGVSKLFGELYVQQFAKKYWILRVSSLYGKYKRNFLSASIEYMKQNKEAKGIVDQISSPTWTRNIAVVIRKFIEKGVYGVFHFSDITPNGVSRYTILKKVIELLGLDVKLVPVYMEELKRPARRPRYSVLDLSITELVIGKLDNWWEKSLEEFVREVYL